MTRLRGLAVVLALFWAETAVAADQQVRPYRGRDGAVSAVEAYPYLLPPCRESFWSTLLHCIPRAEFDVPYDNIYAQNQIRAVPPARRPYIQLFKW